MLSFDYENNKTKFWYYAANATQRDDEYYEPNLFEKEIPLLETRPDFENKDKFISRMENWVLLS